MSKKRKKTRKKLDQVLWELAKAISVVDTVYHALERVDSHPDIGSEYETLKLGIKQLRSAHEALDLAIMANSK